MAEIELNVLMGQCLKRRIDHIEMVKKEVEAWQKAEITKAQRSTGNSLPRMRG